MAELIDLLFIGWCVLAVGVYILGQIFEKQLQEQQRRKLATGQQQRTRPDTTNLDECWSNQQQQSSAYRRSSSSYYSGQPASFSYNSSGGYNSGNYTNNDQAYSNNYDSPASQHFGGVGGVGSSATAYDSATAAGHFPTTSASYATADGAFGGYQASGFNNLTDEPLSYQRVGGQAAVSMQPSVIPTATGFNSDCVEWVNSILYLFYTQPDRYGPIIGENVYRSLNEKLSNIISSSSDYSHLLVEFESLNGQLSTRPELTNIRTECESDKSLSATCKIYNRRLVFNLLIKRLLVSNRNNSDDDDDDQATLRYELVLENLEGKLKSMAMLGDKLIVIQFIEKPDTKILLRPMCGVSSVGHTAPAAGARNQLISEDVLVQMILQTLTQVVVDLYFGNDPDFPQYKAHHQHQQQQQHHHHHNHHPSNNQQSTYSSYKHKINNIFKSGAGELKRSLRGGDLFGTGGGQSHHQQQQQSGPNGAKERKVFVKIIRAKNINYNQNVTCLMELDAPKQQAVSTTKQGSNPFWDEHFLFAVSDKSQELSFELWDSLNLTTTTTTTTTTTAQQANNDMRQLKTAAATTAAPNQQRPDSSTAKFLGLARVSMDELRREPVQKVSLALQQALGTPNDLSNSVGGELQLELLFLEHSTTTAAGAPAQSSQTLPPQLHKSSSQSSLAYQHGDIVSIDRKLTPSGYVITTTKITKQLPQQAQQARQHQQQQQQPKTSYHDQLLVRNQSPGGSSSMATERSFDDNMNDDLDGVSGSAVGRDIASQADGRSESGRLSRPRSRSRSLLRAIKKRFSFSRTRSRSVGGPPSELDYEPARAATSTPGAAAGRLNDGGGELANRSRASSDLSISQGLDGPGGGGSGRAKSVPASREPSEVPMIVINRGRLSDTASAYTFTHPKSQLVIEVLEPTLREDGVGNSKSKGIYRYYAISDDSSNKRKWRKRGTKLHLFNEHQFVASHLASSSTCHLCGRVFSRRPGKQGYKCRQCHLLLHKQCHVKIDHNCPYASRDGLPLEYIDAEPPAQLVNEQRVAPLAQDLTLANMMSSGGSGGGGADRQTTMASGRTITDTTTNSGRSGRLGAKSISMEVDDR